MSLIDRRGLEADALVTDRYLDALLAAGDAPDAHDDAALGATRDGPSDALDRAVRLASQRLTSDLPRFHPSFRFEERLAARLAEAAAAMRLPLAAGQGARIVPLPYGAAGDIDPLGDPLGDPLAMADREDDGADAADDDLGRRPLLVGGAVAASAISLAGAAWLAWRRGRARPSAQRHA